MSDLGFAVRQEDYGASRVDGTRRCNYELSRVMGMRMWLTVMNATVRPLSKALVLPRNVPRKAFGLKSFRSLRFICFHHPLDEFELVLLSTAC